MVCVRIDAQCALLIPPRRFCSKANKLLCAKIYITSSRFMRLENCSGYRQILPNCERISSLSDSEAMIFLSVGVNYSNCQSHF